MHSFETKHNANLLNTLPASAPIVNSNTRAELGEAVEYNENIAPDKLFVMIDNNITEQGLSIRTVEFYCLLTYLIISYPSTKLTILKIQSLILEHTKIKINKNSINKYLNTLLTQGLVSRSNNYLVAHSIGDNCSITKEQKELELKNIKGNTYYAPKSKFKAFYITAYNLDTVRCTLALELYLASKAYNQHRPTKVCKDLNISRKTYYKLLKELLSKGIVTKATVKIDKQKYNVNLYKNTYRQILLEDSNRIQAHRQNNRDHQYRQKCAIRKANEIKLKDRSPARLWYSSPMGAVMKEFGINYIPFFNTYPTAVAYKIVVELKKQYELLGKQLTAPLIVAAIKGNYNWVKILERDHLKQKRDQVKREEYYKTTKGFLENMWSCN